MSSQSILSWAAIITESLCSCAPGRERLLHRAVLVASLALALLKPERCQDLYKQPKENSFLSVVWNTLFSFPCPRLCWFSSILFHSWANLKNSIWVKYIHLYFQEWGREGSISKVLPFKIIICHLHLRKTEQNCFIPGQMTFQNFILLLPGWAKVVWSKNAVSCRSQGYKLPVGS